MEIEILKLTLKIYSKVILKSFFLEYTFFKFQIVFVNMDSIARTGS